MCDIYMAKCKKCNAQIDMHLGDYNTGRDEVEVFCEKHLPDNRDYGVLWRYRENRRNRWKKVYVQALTDTADANRNGNHPNSTELEIDDGSPKGTLEVIKESICSGNVPELNRQSKKTALQKRKVEK